MQFLRTERFRKDFYRLPADLQTRTIAALERLAANPRHPSLHVKKMDGVAGIWELRVTDSYRVTFHRFPGGVLLRRVGTHGILRTP
jgi:mRNA-degrading endonuclease RelE of RelBE toxin-antitoxin system